ncbi:hypothetical protein AVEN_209211-1 [Araneus ventricosus]|uniref:Uncharacterized protein n=1 Tax=Araneus ventricosus TaxID=182803 RepID=A0A4Y2PN34_ARAVE|nr:hypothetical protein AVEN_209211-1 [Araneus ventricosus]
MTRYKHSPSLKSRLVVHVLARRQACSGTVQDGGNAGECLLEYARCSSVTRVQRAFLFKYGKVGHQSILRWFRQFSETGLDDVPLRYGPPGGPISSHVIFFLWGYVKDQVCVPPMPTTLQALQERITAHVTDIDRNMLLNVWTELDYRWDVCLVRGHILNICSIHQEFGECMYLFRNHPSLYFVYL